MSSSQELIPVYGRPDLLAAEFWYLGPATQTLSYIQVDGASPEITNHISAVKYEIIEGCGIIATAHSTTEFNIKDGSDSALEVVIPIREPYAYAGRFSAFVARRLAPNGDNIVTFNGAPLTRPQKHYLRQVKRRAVLDSIIDCFSNTLAMTETMEQYLSIKNCSS